MWPPNNPDINLVDYAVRDALQQMAHQCWRFITETFLQEYVGNGFLDPSAMFNILRKDRQEGKGGGVCAIVKGDIYVTPVLSSTYGS